MPRTPGTRRITAGPAEPVAIMDVDGALGNDDSPLVVGGVGGNPVTVADDWEVVTLSDETLNDTDKAFTVPAGFEWQVLWIWVELTTDANAANRQLRVTMRDASNDVIGQVRTGVTQAANLTYFYMLAPALADLDAVRDTDWLMTPFPPTVFLTAGQDLRVRVNLGQVGDDMIVKMQVARRAV